MSFFDSSFAVTVEFVRASMKELVLYNSILECLYQQRKHAKKRKIDFIEIRTSGLNIQSEKQ